MNTSSRCQPIEASRRTSSWPILVLARSLADEHDLGVGVALAGDGPRPALVEPAGGAGADLVADPLERLATLVGGHAGVPPVTPAP
jgi:hypothetical protein